MQPVAKQKLQAIPAAILISGLLNLTLPGPATAIETPGTLKGLSITDAQATNKPPVITLKTTTNGTTITFDASGTTDLDGSIKEYRWDYGDGTTGSSVLTSHTFNGSHTHVTLTVTDDKGGVAIAQTTVQGYTEPFEIIVDDADSARFTTVGAWAFSTNSPGYYNSGYRTAPVGTGSSVATWTIDIATGGQYEIFCYYTSYSNRATNAPFAIINNEKEIARKEVNQQINGQMFFSLGKYTLNQGNLKVSLSNDANGYLIADTVKVIYNP